MKTFVQSAMKAGQEAAAYRLMSKSSLPESDQGKYHFRKGSPGDWKNHMSAQNKEYMKKKSGTLLLDLGYASKANW